MLSEEMPLRFGPRHWGQSAAGEFAASNVAATIKLSFISYFYHDLRRLHGSISSSQAQRRIQGFKTERVFREDERPREPRL